MLKIQNNNNNVYLGNDPTSTNMTNVDKTEGNIEVVDPKNTGNNVDDYNGNGTQNLQNSDNDEPNQKAQQQLNEIMYRKEQYEIEKLAAKAIEKLNSSNPIEKTEAIDIIMEIAQIEGGRLNSERLSDSQQNIAALVEYNLSAGSDEFFNESYAKLNNNDKKIIDTALKYLNKIPEKYRDEISQDLVNYAIKNASGDYKRDYPDSSIRDLVEKQLLRDITEYNPKLRIALKDPLPSEDKVRAAQNHNRSERAREAARKYGVNLK